MLTIIAVLVFTGVTSGNVIPYEVQVPSLQVCADGINGVIEDSKAGTIVHRETGEVYVLTAAECRVSQ